MAQPRDAPLDKGGHCRERLVYKGKSLLYNPPLRVPSAKLLARDAIHRLLILISDGRPLDGEYKDEYALEDTKTALREARQRGINPFCVTIDREADLYMRRMYGDVQFAVIDRVESLPSRLPRMYHRLTR
ncbi:MAG: hypothetical protein HP491_06015 [Nitrospira sp.]|nr:hypothetical protein [Nitrospira sp.]